jgi:hypothetical protein
MSRKYSRLSLRVAVAASAAAATAVFASSAVAACTTGTSTGCQSVSGTALSSLALTVGTPATFGTSFAPGVSGDQSTGGALVVTDTSPSWHLSVQDQGSGAGHLVADTTLSPLNACNASESQLGQAVSVTVSPAIANPLASFNSDGSVTLSHAAAEVANASSQLLANDILNSTYSQSIGSSEALSAGCIYDLTATYTLQ